MLDKQLKTRVLREEEGHDRRGGALTAHAVAGWEGALHNSQESNVWTAKMQQ